MPRPSETLSVPANRRNLARAGAIRLTVDTRRTAFKEGEEIVSNQVPRPLRVKVALNLLTP